MAKKPRPFAHRRCTARASVLNTTLRFPFLRSRPSRDGQSKAPVPESDAAVSARQRYRHPLVQRVAAARAGLRRHRAVLLSSRDDARSRGEPRRAPRDGAGGRGLSHRAGAQPSATRVGSRAQFAHGSRVHGLRVRKRGVHARAPVASRKRDLRARPSRQSRPRRLRPGTRWNTGGRGSSECRVSAAASSRGERIARLAASLSAHASATDGEGGAAMESARRAEPRGIGRRRRGAPRTGARRALRDDSERRGRRHVRAECQCGREMASCSWEE